MAYLMYGLYGLGGLAVFLLLCGTFFTVRQQTASIIEFFGKFSRIARPGLNVKIPLLEKVVQVVDLRVQQIDVKVETKTEDNVFVLVRVSVQYYVQDGKVYDAFYKLSDPHKQMTAYIYDLIRARVPTLKLDDVFQKKDDIADAVKAELSEEMSGFGFTIVKALVTDIDPDGKVKEAMNEINAATRIRVAAVEKGEAEKILMVKAAEAEAESKRLQGEGIAQQRKAIIEGLRESVEEFQSGIPGTTAQDVMTLVLVTQYLDTLKDVGASSRTNTVLIPHSPGALTDLAEQIRNAVFTGERLSAGANQQDHGGNGTSQPHVD